MKKTCSNLFFNLSAHHQHDTKMITATKRLEREKIKIRSMYLSELIFSNFSHQQKNKYSNRINKIKETKSQQEEERLKRWTRTRTTLKATISTTKRKRLPWSKCKTTIIELTMTCQNVKSQFKKISSLFKIVNFYYFKKMKSQKRRKVYVTCSNRSWTLQFAL